MPDILVDSRREAQILAESARKFRQFQDLRGSLTNRILSDTLRATQNFPLSSTGAVTAMGATGMTQQQATLLAEMDAQAPAPLPPEGGGGVGGFVNGVADLFSDGLDAAYQQVIKPTVRFGFGVIDTAAREIQRPITAGLAVVGGHADSFGEAFRDIGDSPGLNFLQGDLASTDAQGNQITSPLGEGFFIGGQAAARSQQEQTLQIQGGAPTLGRAIAANTVGQFQDPGGMAYSTVEFVTQFSADVLSDPSALLLGGAGPVGRAVVRSQEGIQKGSRTAIALEEGLTGLRRAGNRSRLTLDDVRDIQLATRGQTIQSTDQMVAALKDKFGAAETPWRRTILAEKAQNILNNAPILEELAKRDAFGIYHALSNRSITMSDELLAGLAGATETQAASDLLASAMSLGDVRNANILRGVGTFRPQPFGVYFSKLPVVGERLMRFGGMNPAGIYSADDLLGSAARLDNLERQAFVPETVRRQHFNEMVDLANPARAEEAAVKAGDAIDDVFDTDDIDELIDLVGGDDVSSSFDGMLRSRIADLADADYLKLGRDDLNELVDRMGELDDLVKRGEMTASEGSKALKEVREEYSLPRGFANSLEFRKEVDRILRLNDPRNLTRRYAYDDLGTPSGGPTARFDGPEGSPINAPSAQSLADLSDFAAYIDEDTVRGIRRAAERNAFARNIYNRAGWDYGTRAARFLTRDVFKPLVLLRPAYFAREFVDGMIRQSAYNAPTDTAFTNPMAYAGYLYRARRDGENLREIMGRPFREQATESSLLAHEHLGLLDEGDQLSARYRNMAESRAPRVSVNDEGERVFLDHAGNETTFEQHARSWRFLLQHRAKDPLFQSLHRFGYDIDSWIENWAMKPEGRSYFDRLAKSSDEFAGLSGQALDGNLDDLRRMAEFRRAEMIGGTVEGQNFSGYLGGVDTPLHQIFADGGIGEADDFVDLFDPGTSARRKIEKALEEHAEVAPPIIFAPSRLDVSENAIKGMKERFVQLMANSVMSGPSNKYLRLPALRQRMVANITEVLPEIEDSRVRQAIIDSLGNDLSLSRREIKALKEAGDRPGGIMTTADFGDDVSEAIDSISLDRIKDRLLQADESLSGAQLTQKAEAEFRRQVQAAILQTDVASYAYDIAKARTFDEAADMFFDVSNRSNLQSNFDVAVPFVDAYAEAIESYARLLKENPSFFIRGFQSYQFMREEGFFYVNDYGEEVFTMPGGGALSAFIRRMNEAGNDLTDLPFAAAGAVGDSLTGNIPDNRVQLEGRVQGLNIALQGVGPGFGPLVQWAAGAFLPDTEDFRTLQEFVNPFGSEFANPSDLANLADWISSLTPAWMHKVGNAITSGDLDPVQFNSMVNDALNALAETEGYDPADPYDQQRLARDAEKAARYLLMVRGIAQGIAPTGPSATWQIKVGGDETGNLPTAWDPETDPDGVFFTLATLAGDYHTMYTNHGNQASQKFVEKYGHEPYYLTQSASRSLGQLPTTRQGQSWVDRHRDQANIYASVIGFFAPEEATDDFDFNVYRRQIEEGRLQQLTPQQQLQLATQIKARSIYYGIKSQIDDIQAGGKKIPGNARQTMLATVRGRLEEAAPGWNLGILGVGERGDLFDRLALMKRAAFDEALADSEITPSLRTYFNLRDQLLDAASQRAGRPLDRFGSTRDADLLEALQFVGTRIMESDPNFQSVWASFLSREVN